MNKLKKYQMFIDGEWVDSENNKTFETLNPENNEPWAVVPEASANDVNKAVNAAQKAFEGDWPKLLPKERAKFLIAKFTSSAHSIPQRCLPSLMILSWLLLIILFNSCDISTVEPTSCSPVITCLLYTSPSPRDY